MACDPDKQSGPRCIEVSFFVALGNGEHGWQCLELTCGVTVAFLTKEVMMQVMIERNRCDDTTYEFRARVEMMCAVPG